MTDRIDHTDAGATAARTAFGRREMLQRTGFVVGAAALWATPVVQTIGMRSAAATVVADFCPENQGRITQMDISYTGDGCNVVTPGAQALEECDSPAGDGAGALPGTAYIVVEVGNCGAGGGSQTSAQDRSVGVPFDAGLTDGGSQACTRMTVYDEEGGTMLASVRIHTSCSEEINIGEQYGPLKVEGGTWVPA